jgi:hypothetical protein
LILQQRHEEDGFRTPLNSSPKSTGSVAPSVYATRVNRRLSHVSRYGGAHTTWTYPNHLVMNLPLGLVYLVEKACVLRAPRENNQC